MLKVILYIFLILWPLVFSSQNKIKPIFGLALTSGNGQLVPTTTGITSKNKKAIGYYFDIGFQKKINRTYIFYAGLRFGTENSRFQFKKDEQQAPFQHVFTNRVLSLQIAPGVVLNKHQRLFITLGIARIFQSNVAGGGGGAAGNNEYDYMYANNLTSTNCDLRLGIKWQSKPRLEKKFQVNLGIETSTTQHRGQIELDYTNYNNPNKVYSVSYNFSLVYLDFQF